MALACCISDGTTLMKYLYRLCWQDGARFEVCLFKQLYIQLALFITESLRQVHTFCSLLEVLQNF